MIKKFISILLSLALLWTSGNVAQAAALSSEVFVAPSDLPQFQLIPPRKLGRITDYFNSTGGSEEGKKRGSDTSSPPLVILIQDLHAHYGVQKNIAGLLEFLSQKLSPTSSLPRSLTPSPSFALAVEGASGPVDSSLMALFPDAQVKEEASQFLMREGELTGAEYFAIKHSLPHFLAGAENGEFYTLHRDLFRKTIDSRQAMVQALTSIQTDISALPKVVYGPALKGFQKKIDAWDKGEITTEEYVGFLVSEYRRIGVSAKNPDVTPTRPHADTPIPDLKQDFPALAAFASNGKLSARSSSFSPDALRAATAEFFTNSASYLSAEEKKNLSVLAKQTDSTAYYLYVRELIYTHQLFLAAPPDLAAYLEFLHTEQTVGMDRVLHEARELAFRIKLLRAVSKQEKDLVQVQHDLDLLKRLADLQATEDEVRDFAPRLNQFVALTQALLKSDASGPHPSFDDVAIRSLISSSIDYYVIAMLRNQPMVDNTLALLGEQTAGDRDGGVTVTAGSPQRQRVVTHKKHKHLSPPSRSSRRNGYPAIAVTRPSSDVAVLVAGGFHTAPMTRILRERNISYIVISPTVDKISQADRDLYVKRLSGKLLTEDEILAKLTAPEPSSQHGGVLNLRQAIALFHPFQNQKPDSLAVGMDVLTPAHKLAAMWGVIRQEKGGSPTQALSDLETKLKPEIPQLDFGVANSVKSWIQTERNVAVAPNHEQLPVAPASQLAAHIPIKIQILQFMRIVKLFAIAFLSILGVDDAAIQTPRTTSISGTLNLAAGPAVRVSAEFANERVRAGLPDDLLDKNPAPELLDPYRRNPKSRLLWNRVPVIPIKDLFRTTGQLGHIGLGQYYGEPVIYVDADYGNVPLVLTHERIELLLWNLERILAGEQWNEMRRRMDSEPAITRVQEKFFHFLAFGPRVSKLIKETAQKVQLNISPRAYDRSRTINLAAGSEDKNEEVMRIQIDDSGNIQNGAVQLRRVIRDNGGETLRVVGVNDVDLERDKDALMAFQYVVQAVRHFQEEYGLAPRARIVVGYGSMRYPRIHVISRKSNPTLPEDIQAIIIVPDPSIRDMAAVSQDKLGHEVFHALSDMESMIALMEAGQAEFTRIDSGSTFVDHDEMMALWTNIEMRSALMHSARPFVLYEEDVSFGMNELDLGNNPIRFDAPANTVNAILGRNVAVTLSTLVDLAKIYGTTTVSHWIYDPTLMDTLRRMRFINIEHFVVELLAADQRQSGGQHRQAILQAFEHRGLNMALVHDLLQNAPAAKPPADGSPASGLFHIAQTTNNIAGKSLITGTALKAIGIAGMVFEMAMGVLWLPNHDWATRFLYVGIYAVITHVAPMLINKRGPPEILKATGLVLLYAALPFFHAIPLIYPLLLAGLLVGQTMFDLPKILSEYPWHRLWGDMKQDHWLLYVSNDFSPRPGESKLQGFILGALAIPKAIAVGLYLTPILFVANLFSAQHRDRIAKDGAIGKISGLWVLGGITAVSAAYWFAVIFHASFLAIPWVAAPLAVISSPWFLAIFAGAYLIAYIATRPSVWRRLDREPTSYADMSTADLLHQLRIVLSTNGTLTLAQKNQATDMLTVVMNRRDPSGPYGVNDSQKFNELPGILDTFEAKVGPAISEDPVAGEALTKALPVLKADAEAYITKNTKLKKYGLKLLGIIEDVGINAVNLTQADYNMHEGDPRMMLRMQLREGLDGHIPSRYLTPKLIDDLSSLLVAHRNKYLEIYLSLVAAQAPDAIGEMVRVHNFVNPGAALTVENAVLPPEDAHQPSNAISEFNQNQGLKAVEFGSGDGLFLTNYRSQYPDESIMGFDPDASESAVSKIPGLIRQDARHTDIKSHSVNKVIINHFFPVVPGGAMSEVLREAYRILAPGGEIHVIYADNGEEPLLLTNPKHRDLETNIRQMLQESNFAIEEDGLPLNDVNPNYPASRFTELAPGKSKIFVARKIDPTASAPDLTRQIQAGQAVPERFYGTVANGSSLDSVLAPTSRAEKVSDTKGERSRIYGTEQPPAGPGEGRQIPHHLPLYLWKEFLPRLINDPRISNDVRYRILAGQGVARFEADEAGRNGRVVLEEEALSLLTEVLNEFRRSRRNPATRTAALMLTTQDVRDYLIYHEMLHSRLADDRGRRLIQNLIEQLRAAPFDPTGLVPSYKSLKQQFVNNYGAQYKNDEAFAEELLVVYLTERDLLNQSVHILPDLTRPDNTIDLPESVSRILDEARLTEEDESPALIAPQEMTAPADHLMTATRNALQALDRNANRDTIENTARRVNDLPSSFLLASTANALDLVMEVLNKACGLVSFEEAEKPDSAAVKTTIDIVFNSLLQELVIPDEKLQSLDATRDKLVMLDRNILPEALKRHFSHLGVEAIPQVRFLLSRILDKVNQQIRIRDAGHTPGTPASGPGVTASGTSNPLKKPPHGMRPDQETLNPHESSTPMPPFDSETNDSRIKIDKTWKIFVIFPFVFIGHLIHEPVGHALIALSNGLSVKRTNVLFDPHVRVSEIEKNADFMNLADRAVFYDHMNYVANAGFVANYVVTGLSSVGMALAWGHSTAALYILAYVALSNLIVGIANSLPDAKDRQQARYFKMQAQIAFELSRKGVEITNLNEALDLALSNDKRLNKVSREVVDILKKAGQIQRDSGKPKSPPMNAVDALRKVLNPPDNLNRFDSTIQGPENKNEPDPNGADETPFPNGGNNTREIGASVMRPRVGDSIGKKGSNSVGTIYLESPGIPEGIAQQRIARRESALLKFANLVAASLAPYFVQPISLQLDSQGGTIESGYIENIGTLDDVLQKRIPTPAGFDALKALQELHDEILNQSPARQNMMDFITDTLIEHPNSMSHRDIQDLQEQLRRLPIQNGFMMFPQDMNPKNLLITPEGRLKMVDPGRNFVEGTSQDFRIAWDSYYHPSKGLYAQALQSNPTGPAKSVLSIGGSLLGIGFFAYLGAGIFTIVSGLFFLYQLGALVLHGRRTGNYRVGSPDWVDPTLSMPRQRFVQEHERWVHFISSSMSQRRTGPAWEQIFRPLLGALEDIFLAPFFDLIILLYLPFKKAPSSASPPALPIPETQEPVESKPLSLDDYLQAHGIAVGLKSDAEWRRLPVFQGSEKIAQLWVTYYAESDPKDTVHPGGIIYLNQDRLSAPGALQEAIHRTALDIATKRDTDLKFHYLFDDNQRETIVAEIVPTPGQVWVPLPLRDYTDGKKTVAVHGPTVMAALEDLMSQYPELRSRILADDGQLKKGLALFRNDEQITGSLADAEFNANDTLDIIPAIVGGSDVTSGTPSPAPVDLTPAEMRLAGNFAIYLFEHGMPAEEGHQVFQEALSKDLRTFYYGAPSLVKEWLRLRHEQFTALQNKQPLFFKAANDYFQNLHLYHELTRLPLLYPDNIALMANLLMKTMAGLPEQRHYHQLALVGSIGGDSDLSPFFGHKVRDVTWSSDQSTLPAMLQETLSQFRREQAKKVAAALEKNTLRDIADLKTILLDGYEPAPADPFELRRTLNQRITDLSSRAIPLIAACPQVTEELAAGTLDLKELLDEAERLRLEDTAAQLAYQAAGRTGGSQIVKDWWLLVARGQWEAAAQHGEGRIIRESLGGAFTAEQEKTLFQIIVELLERDTQRVFNATMQYQTYVGGKSAVQAGQYKALPNRFSGEHLKIIHRAFLRILDRLPSDTEYKDLLALISQSNGTNEAVEAIAAEKAKKLESVTFWDEIGNLLEGGWLLITAAPDHWVVQPYLINPKRTGKGDTTISDEKWQEYLRTMQIEILPGADKKTSWIIGRHVQTMSRHITSSMTRPADIQLDPHIYHADDGISSNHLELKQNTAREMTIKNLTKTSLARLPSLHREGRRVTGDFPTGQTIRLTQDGPLPMDDVPDVSLTLRGTYWAAFFHYLKHPKQFIDHLRTLKRLNQRSNFKRAVQLFFAPVHEKKALLENILFVLLHKGTAAQQALRQKSVGFIIKNAGKTAEEAEAVLSDFLSLLEATEPLTSVTHAAEVVFGMSLAKIIEEHGMDVLLHFVHNFVRSDTPLTIENQKGDGENLAFQFATEVMKGGDPIAAQQLSDRILQNARDTLKNMGNERTWVIMNPDGRKLVADKPLNFVIETTLNTKLNKIPETDWTLLTIALRMIFGDRYDFAEKFGETEERGNVKDGQTAGLMDFRNSMMEQFVASIKDRIAPNAVDRAIEKLDVALADQKTERYRQWALEIDGQFNSNAEYWTALKQALNDFSAKARLLSEARTFNLATINGLPEQAARTTAMSHPGIDVVLLASVVSRITGLSKLQSMPVGGSTTIKSNLEDATARGDKNLAALLAALKQPVDAAKLAASTSVELPATVPLAAPAPFAPATPVQSAAVRAVNASPQLSDADRAARAAAARAEVAADAAMLALLRDQSDLKMLTNHFKASLEERGGRTREQAEAEAPTHAEAHLQRFQHILTSMPSHDEDELAERYANRVVDEILAATPAVQPAPQADPRQQFINAYRADPAFNGQDPDARIVDMFTGTVPSGANETDIQSRIMNALNTLRQRTIGQDQSTQKQAPAASETEIAAYRSAVAEKLKEPLKAKYLNAEILWNPIRLNSYVEDFMNQQGGRILTGSALARAINTYVGSVSIRTGGSIWRESLEYTAFGGAALLESAALLEGMKWLLLSQHLTQSPFIFAVTAVAVFFVMHLPQLKLTRDIYDGKTRWQRVKSLFTWDFILVSAATLAVAFFLPGHHMINPNYAIGALTIFHSIVNGAARRSEIKLRLAALADWLNFIGRWRQQRQLRAFEIAQAKLAITNAMSAEGVALPGTSAFSPTFTPPQGTSSAVTAIERDFFSQA